MNDFPKLYIAFKKLVKSGNSDLTRSEFLNNPSIRSLDLNSYRNSGYVPFNMYNEFNNHGEDFFMNKYNDGNMFKSGFNSKNNYSGYSDSPGYSGSPLSSSKKPWIIAGVVLLICLIISIIIVYFIVKYFLGSSNTSSGSSSFSDYNQYSQVGEILIDSDSNYKLDQNVFKGGNVEDCKLKCDNKDFNSFTYNNIDNTCYLHKHITDLKYNDVLTTYVKKDPSRTPDYKKHENFSLQSGGKSLSDTILLNEINKVDTNFENSVESCKEICTNLWNCTGFTHNKSENSCTLYNHFPIGKQDSTYDTLSKAKTHDSKILKPDTNYDTYKLIDLVSNYNEVEQTTLKNPLSSDNKAPNVIKTVDTLDPSKCKETCDDEEYCSGFVINKDNQNCELHSKIHNIEDYNLIDGVNIWNKVSVNIPEPVKHVDKSNPYDTVFESTNLPLDKCKKVCKDLKDCRGFDWVKDSNTSIPYGTCKFKKNIPNNDENAEFNIFNNKTNVESYAFETKI
jgi:hypothetical protein